MARKLIESYWLESAAVVELLQPQLIDQIELEQVKQEIRQAFGENAAPHVVIDFSRVKHCASSMISVLIELRAQIEGEGGQLILANVSPDLRELFRIVRLDSVFAMFDSTREAVDSLQDGD